MRRTTAFLCALAALLAFPGLAAADDGPGLRGGAAAVDITPPVGTPMFAYTARERVYGYEKFQDPEVGLTAMLADPDRGLHAKTFVPSTGVHMRLYARTVVLERSGVPSALVQVDLGGVPYAMTAAVVARLTGTGIDEQHLMLSATHTHSGTGPIWGIDNMGYGALGGDLIDPRIFNFTADRIASSVRLALADLQQARVGVGTSTLTDASSNRAGGPFRRNAGVDASTQDIDPDLTVIRVDSAAGDPIAVWSNFAVHATSFGDDNYLFSADNPGITERLVEKAIGSGVVNVWTNGNEGDMTPRGDADIVGGEPAQYTTGGGFDEAYLAGKRVAVGVLHAWSDAADHMRSDVEIEALGGHLPFDGTSADGEPVGPNPVLGLNIAAGDGTCAPAENMAGPGQGYKGYLYGHPGVVPGSAPVAIWRIGDLGITAVPSEVTMMMGKRIREAIRQNSGGKLDRVIMAGLSNGYISYTATPEEYDACEYEGGFTLFGRQQGPRFRDYSVALTKSLFDGAPAPPSIVFPHQVDQSVPGDLPAEQTPDAGAAVTQPPASVARTQRISFTWKGGDRSTDAPPGQTFVRLERKVGDDWRLADDDDSFADFFQHGAGNTWTETYQFSSCNPLGSYRFRVTGVADKGNGPEPYSVTSGEFELTAAKLEIAGNRALYPTPGPKALFATPRLVLDGKATLSNGQKVNVDDETGTFPVPAGESISSVEDGCGNAS